MELADTLGLGSEKRHSTVMMYGSSIFLNVEDIHCKKKKIKEHFENTPDLNGEGNHAGYLYWYTHGTENDQPTEGWIQRHPDNQRWEENAAC